MPVRLVLDESSKEDQVHLLVLGLAYQGIVLPLAVRCWPQTAPLTAGEYWTQVGSLLWEVHGLLPPVLRDHVLVLADRGYGSPRWIDLLQLLTWGAKVARRTPLGSQTPALCWTLPVWEAPLWSAECHRVYAQPT